MNHGRCTSLHKVGSGPGASGLRAVLPLLINASRNTVLPSRTPVEEPRPRQHQLQKPRTWTWQQKTIFQPPLPSMSPSSSGFVHVLAYKQEEGNERVKQTQAMCLFPRCTENAGEDVLPAPSPELGSRRSC